MKFAAHHLTLEPSAFSLQPSALPPCPRSTAAFSLVEVLCAILILGVGIVGLTTGITGAIGSGKDAQLQTAAALMASGLIETIRAEGYVIEGEDEGEGGPGLESCRWRQSILNSDIDGLYEVKVVVEHTATGRAVYELDTMLFDPPVYPSSYSTSTEDPNQSGNNASPASRRNRGRQP